MSVSLLPIIAKKWTFNDSDSEEGAALSCCIIVIPASFSCHNVLVTNTFHNVIMSNSNMTDNSTLWFMLKMTDIFPYRFEKIFSFSNPIHLNIVIYISYKSIVQPWLLHNNAMHLLLILTMNYFNSNNEWNKIILLLTLCNQNFIANHAFPLIKILSIIQLIKIAFELVNFLLSPFYWWANMMISDFSYETVVFRLL